MNRYDKIINLPHHVSAVRIPMPLCSRASQFASFAALTGYEEEICEATDISEPLPELTEERIEKLNMYMHKLILNGAGKFINVEYFEHRKKGDVISGFSGSIRRISEDEGFIEFTDKTRIWFSDIYNIDDICDTFF